jgi:hypothetical protein
MISNLIFNQQIGISQTSTGRYTDMSYVSAPTASSALGHQQNVLLLSEANNNS